MPRRIFTVEGPKGLAHPQFLGGALRLLSSHEPFATYPLHQIVSAVSLQLSQATALVAHENGQILAYLGWHWTRREMADAWKRGGAHFTALPLEKADAIAITMLVAEGDMVLPLIREAKHHSHGLPVYWKRHVPKERPIMRSVP